VLAAASIVAALLCTAAIGAPSHGRDGSRPQVRILGPRAGAQIGARTLIRVRAKGPRFRAYLNGRDMSGRFHRDGNGLRTAHLQLGRDVHPGDVSLLVRVGRRGHADSDLRYYYAVRHGNRSAKLTLSWDRRRHAAPLLHLRTHRRIRSVKVWLNGKRVDHQFRTDEDGRGVSARLAPHAGLHYGRNRVVFLALQRGGTIARKSRAFRIRRGRPLADAGADKQVGAGRPTLLDAAASLPEARGQGGAGLQYHWQVLRAPAGSRAKVSKPSSMRSRFVPDVPGSYLLRVAVRDPAGHTSVDEAQLEAPQTVAPMGIPIQTRTADGGIQVGIENFPPQGSWVQMLVLSAGRGTPLAGAWGSFEQGFAIGESSKLLEEVQKTGPDQLVILSGQPGSSGAEPQAAKNLTAAIEFLGGTVQTWGPTPDGAEDLWQGVQNQWSLIGHVGLARAAAQQNISYSEAGIPGFMNGEAGQRGSLNGYLQAVTTLGFEFVSPENVSLDTKWTPSPGTAPSATQNTIAVGAQHYESATIPAGEIAIQLLLLEPSTLQLLSNRTFGVIDPNGQTNFGGIYYLDQALHELNATHTVGYSPLIILQDFGRNGASAWPGGNATDWLQDTLPHTADSREWSGNRYPNSTEQLFKSWNEANVHGFGSVAGNLGELVGPSFHDVVANYRRPYFDPGAANGKGEMVPRVTGGLTMVTEPHLYQWSSAFGQGQSDPALSGGGETLANGRITGTLSRNQQAQWQLSSPAEGAGFELSSNPKGQENDLLDPEALWNLVFEESVPWPCSVALPAPCPSRPSQIAAADRYLGGRLFDASVFDVREMYNHTESWDTLRSTMEEKTPYPPGRGFSREVFNALRTQLSTEFDDLEEVKTGIDAWQEVIGGAGEQAHMDIEGATGKVLTAVQEAEGGLLQHEAEINAAATSSDALLIGSSIIELGLSLGLSEELAFAPPALGGISALIALGDDVFGEGTEASTTPSESQQAVDDDTEAIHDSVGNLGKDLQARYNAINATMGHFQDVFATDWGKLQLAATDFRTVWALETEEQKLIGHSITVGAERQLYDTTVPLAYSQWIISPQDTDINGLAALEPPNKDYACRPTANSSGADGNYVDSNEPIGGISAVQWTGGSTGFKRQPYTVRMLKPWADNLEAKTTSNFNGLGTPDTYVPNTGGNPPASLLDPLFEPSSVTENPLEPTDLGLDKDSFFGQPMGMQQLQCGAVPETPEEEEEG
jgi:hypothetical protein